MKHICRNSILSIVLGVSFAGSVQGTIVGVALSGQLVRIDPSTGVGENIGTAGSFRLNSLASNSQGTLYSASVDGDLVTIDPATGVATFIAEIDFGFESVSVRSLAFSPNGELYATNNSFPMAFWPHDLWTINVLTGVGTKIGSLGTGIQALDFGPDGRLYGYDFGTQGTAGSGGAPGLSIIDPLTATVTDLDPTVPSINIQSLLFVGEKLYGASGAFYELNPASGAAQLIGNISDPFQESFIRGIESVVPEPTSVANLIVTGIGWLLAARFKRG